MGKKQSTSSPTTPAAISCPVRPRSRMSTLPARLPSTPQRKRTAQLLLSRGALTPRVRALPQINYTPVTSAPGAKPHKKFIETHIAQTRKILASTTQSLATPKVGGGAADMQKRLGKIGKVIAKVKVEKQKNYDYAEKKYKDALMYLAAMGQTNEQVQQKLLKEKARHTNWEATFKMNAEGAAKTLKKESAAWQNSVAPKS